MIQVFNRSFETVAAHLGELKTDVKGLCTTVEQIDKRLSNVEQTLAGDHECRLRAPEEIVLRKAS